MKLCSSDNHYSTKTTGEFDTFPEILAEVRKFEVKKVSKIISKLTLQIMGFVYTCMMDSPNFGFLISAFTFAKFLEGLNHLTTFKLYLHHSHVIGKIHRHAHDFCNLKVKESQNFFSCLAHNFFGFDFCRH